jgi:hypothetical protein
VEFTFVYWGDFWAVSQQSLWWDEGGSQTCWISVQSRCELQGHVLRWGEVVHELVAKRKYLLETIAQISTLGG